MQTITNARAYSPPNSSCCGAEAAYSLTFEFPMQEVPPSMRKTVEVEAMLWLTASDAKIKFVLQTDGNQESISWQGVETGIGSAQTGSWQKFKHTFQIPDAARNAKVIKAYVFNPTNDLVYLDDFKVMFK